MEFSRGPLRFAALALFAISVLVVGFFLWKRHTRSWLDAHSDRRSSPRIVSGQLKNGLRYAILPNAQSPGHVSFRLLVEAGSLHERDAEIGYAHFVEHMAFNGTRNFPAGELIRFLQLGGAQFGAHVNAYTAHTYTLYQLDLSKTTPATVSTGLSIFRDVADGLRFEPFEVERERGVIHSEELSRRYTRRGLPAARELAIFSGTLVSQRPPIGTPGSVDHASSSALRAFYEAWYRPERMIVVLVGDVGPANNVEKSIQSTFDSLTARAPARPEPDPGKLTTRPNLDVTLHASDRKDIQVEFGTIRRETPPPDNAVRRLAQLHLETAHQMIRRRASRSQSEDPAESKISASIGEQRSFEAFRRNVIDAAGPAARLEDIVSTCEQTLRAALEHGFHPSELPPVQESLRGHLRRSTAAATAPRNPALASQIVACALSHRACVFPDETQDEDRRGVDALTVEGCHAALCAAWANAPQLLFASVPQKDAPSAEKFSAALAASSRRAVSKPQPIEATSNTPVDFPYHDFGSPGKIRFENRVPDLDVRQVCFANGVRLNLKRTDFENQRVHVHLRLGSGRLDEPPEKSGLGLWFLSLSHIGVGRMEAPALTRLLAEQGIRQGTSIGADFFGMTQWCPTDALPLALQILTARLTDSVFPASAEANIRAQLERTHHLYAPPTDFLLSGGDSRFGPASSSAYSKQTLADFEKWIAPALRSGPLELTIVGDFDPDAAINEVALTLGTLPLRELLDDRPELHRLRLPRPPNTRTLKFTASDRPSTLSLHWLIDETLTAPKRQQLLLLAVVFENRLREKIREELGATYTPSAGLLWRRAYPGYAYLHARIDVDPARAWKLADTAGQLAVTIGKKGVSTDELVRARAQRLGFLDEFLTFNSTWLDILSDFQTRPESLADLRQLKSLVATATIEEINALAARYLTRENLFLFVLEPSPPANPPTPSTPPASPRNPAQPAPSASPDAPPEPPLE